MTRIKKAIVRQRYARLGTLAEVIREAASVREGSWDSRGWYTMTIAESVALVTKYDDYREVAIMLLTSQWNWSLKWAADNCERRNCARNRKRVPRKVPRYVS